MVPDDVVALAAEEGAERGRVVAAAAPRYFPTPSKALLVGGTGGDGGLVTIHVYPKVKAR